MASSPNHNSIKIHEHCHVSPQSSTHSSSYPLTFFDLLWLRFHPVERIFFYKFPIPQTESESDPSSFFFDKLVPKLKTSLSLTLQHFLPLAGNIAWPSDSEIPFIQYNPVSDDGVSLLIAEAENTNFDNLLDNFTPHEASEARSFVPHLDSSDSHASVMSLQITLIPNSGFCIGISTHHAVLDGKSSSMFIKAWASICKLGEESESSPCLVPELEPFFDRKVIKDSTGLHNIFSIETLPKLFPNDNSNERSLKILPFPPKVENSARSTFELTRADLEKIKKRVLSKWDTVEDNEAEPPIVSNPKPHTLSTFVLTCAYVSTCIAKAIQGVERERKKFAFAFTVDCRARLDPPISGNYFGNCVWGQFVDIQPLVYIQEDGVVIVAKMICHKIKMLDKKGVFDGAKDMLSKYMSMSSEKVEIMGIAGSNRFGVYGIDFGWGRPEKVEITSIDRGLTIGISESKDGSGGIEVGLVLNKNVMDLFSSIFHEGLIDGK